MFNWNYLCNELEVSLNFVTINRKSELSSKMMSNHCTLQEILKKLANFSKELIGIFSGFQLIKMYLALMTIVKKNLVNKKTIKLESKNPIT